MNTFFDKEFHPVIEAYISEFVEDEMGEVEKNAFEELLVHDDDIRDLALNAKRGKQLFERLHQLKTMDAFVKRLKNSLSG